MPVVVGGIIPRADEEAMLEAGVARVYTPKDFEITRIMGDIVGLVAERHGAAAAAWLDPTSSASACARATARRRRRRST